MAITAPDTAPAKRPPVEVNVEAPPPAIGHPPAPSQLPTTPDQPARKRGIVGGLILVAVGVSALFANWLPGGGAWLFLGLACAFLVTRILTGHRGYAVPAGLLLGFGSFVLLSEAGNAAGPASSGLFFIFLGLGFLASYAIAARPAATWPILPGLILVGFGTFIQARTFGAPFVDFWWLAQFWPLVLVALGAWLLLRDRIPAEAQAPVMTVGAAVLILVGLLVAASAVVETGIPYGGAPLPVPMPWPMVPAPAGSPPVQDTLTLSAPVDGISSIRLVNTSGSTLVRASAASEATVQAPRHFWTTGGPPDVRLEPAGGVLVVDSLATSPSTSGAYVDYVVDVPVALGADVRSASGGVTISGLAGPVQIATASGGVDAHDLHGATAIDTASGATRITDVTGDLRVSSASGGISGTGLSRVNSARTMSGGIDLVGDFASSGQITTTSGAVALGFTPPASVHIDAASLSGDVRATGLGLSNGSVAPHSLSGDVRNGGPTISVRTTSGAIRLFRGA